MMPERDSEPIEVPARVPTTAQNRAPPQRAVLVLAVWGHRFVQQFLDVGLPTLLAPGNVPGVATLLPTEFVILTGMRDEVMIRNHAAFALLSAACTVRIQLIDELITDDNHSTTLTLDYTRVLRGFEAAMTETCFLFLVSDYIMADGSLVSVIKRMQKGVSAVLVGNFQ